MTTKPKPLIVQAYVEKGQLKVPSRKALAAALKHWPDGPCDVEIRPFEERRRIRANNFYWKAIDLVVKHERDEGIGNGWDKAGWHLKLAERFNGITLSEIDKATGEVTERVYGLSTAKLSIAAFSEYLDNCLNFFAEEYGLLIEPTKAEDWRERDGKAAA